MYGMELEDALDQACAAALSVPRAWISAEPGDQLRTLRHSRGVSQRHLADAAGVSQSVVCRLERGADARWTIWRSLFTALGYDAVLTPLSTSEDAEDLLEVQAQERQDRMEAGRMRRR
jgi:transcriptional regulator with XRE-family HTH domain